MKNRNKTSKNYLSDRETDAELNKKEKELAQIGLKGLLQEAKRNAECNIWDDIGLGGL